MENISQISKPRIYTVATSHLDTSWNWDFETSVREYILNTLVDNFVLFEKYPEYRFSFEGSYRYELMEEYYPELFEKLKEYIAQGRWSVTGSSYENGDMNIPSPEALFRNILYGNDYFDKKFGKRSIDIYLPDCFGFGFTLPSIAKHANLNGFTTQKLTWSSAYGIPFDLGKWYGIDGSCIYASLNGFSYSASLENVRENEKVTDKLKSNMEDFDLPFTFVFHGTGDIGGAPKEESVKVVCGEIDENENSDIEVISAPADRVFRDMDTDLSETQREKLPVWRTELISTNHGVGCYTSRAVGKRWNRRGEQLADAAERSLVLADLLKTADYPKNVLDTAWKRIIAHQFHDDITGTSIQVCYKRNWNDYILSLNQLSEEYRFGVSAVAKLLNTTSEGVPVVVNNPVQCLTSRKGTVAATVTMPEKCNFVKVFDKDGNEVPSQISSKNGKTFDILFSADVPSLGYSVYDVRASKEPCSISSGLNVSVNSLENEKYIVTIDENGDICSIVDKTILKELLKKPVRMALHEYNGSSRWPAWELVYDEVVAAPREYACNPVFEIVEKGPSRISIKTTRTADGSTFEQIISLDLYGESINVYNEIDWRSRHTLLKTEFPLSASNKKASYDLGLGVIERGNDTEPLYEVPAQMWADITADDRSFGVSILSDSKCGWDKPTDNTLRLTGIHTPSYKYKDESRQDLMDLGINRYSFGIYSHSGSYKNGTNLVAACFNQPMNAFTTVSHNGKLGKEYSFAGLSTDAVVLRALKKAQNSDEIVVRFNEINNKPQTDVVFRIGNGIESAREIYASEEDKGNAVVKDGCLVFDINAFEPKSFALTLKSNDVEGKISKSTAVALPYNTDIVSWNEKKEDGSLPSGVAVPAELFPKEIVSGGVSFKTGKTSNGALNAVLCEGQTIELPAGTSKLYVVAASFCGDKDVSFVIGDCKNSVNIADGMENVGAWDLFGLGETGYIKKDILAWDATHAHSSNGDVYAQNVYFFKYAFDIPAGVTEFTLPKNKEIVVLSASAVKNEYDFNTATELYDSLERRAFDFKE